MPLPYNYRKSSEAGIATYDFYDFAEGTGYVTFYGAITRSATLSGAILVTDIINSDVVESRAAVAATSATKVFDKDFDLTFNSPKIVKGKLYADIPAKTSVETTGYDYNIYLKTLIRKWDGTTETEIASETSATRTENDGGINHESRFLITVPIPITKFKKGETLRITIEAYAWKSGEEGNSWWAVGHDPASRQTTYTADGKTHFLGTNTQMKIAVPFVVDL